MVDQERIRLAGGDFQVLVAGDPAAPVALCLHGFPDHPPSFVPLLRALSGAGYRAVAPWLRGYAPSTREGPFDVERLAGDVVELADALSPGRPVSLVGHDWGAVITYVVAGLWPERVAAAVAMAVPHPLAFLRDALRRPDQLRRSWYMGLFQLPWAAERALQRRDYALVDRLYRDWSPGLAPRPEAMRELKRCLGRSMPAPIAYYRAALRPAGLRRALAVMRRGRIQAPLLYLAGDQDGCIDPTIGRGEERFFGGAYQRETVPGVGHFMQIERPDEIATRILRWFNPPLGRG